MSALWWYGIIVTAQLLVVLLLAYVVRQFGAYTRQGLAALERGERIVRRGEDVAIQFRACVAWLHDLEHEKRRDHPVIPPDSEPDDLERQEVA